MKLKDFIRLRLALIGVASAAAAFAASPASAHETHAKALTIVHPSTVEPKAGDTAPLVVSMTIETKGADADRLIKAETPLSADVRIVSGDGGAAIPIPKTGTLRLSRTGSHIEIANPKGTLVGYGTFPMTLTFEKRGAVAIEVMIEEREGDETGHTAGHAAAGHDHKQPGKSQ